MKLRELMASATAHLTGNDVVGLLLAATLLGPVSISMFGRVDTVPLGLPGAAVVIGVAVFVGIIYLAGVKARHDMTLARALWEAALVIPCSFLFGWLIESRTDPFFTAKSLYEVAAILLVLSVMAGLLERSAARGTPSDVMASTTSSIAVVGILLFWLFLALWLQPASAILLLLVALLIMITVLLRLPGALVPVYAGTWRRRRSRPR